MSDMRQFFKQCLDDLEPLTGIRQLYFLQSDPNGKNKTTLLLDSMVRVSEMHTSIPEEDQKKIVLKMMVEDQSYEALSARVLNKWLSLFKNNYPTPAQEDEQTTDIRLRYEAMTPEQQKVWRREYEEIYGVNKGIFLPDDERIVVQDGPPVINPRIAEFRNNLRSKAPDPPLQKFKVAGVEVEAHTIEEARMLHRQMIESQIEGRSTKSV